MCLMLLSFEGARFHTACRYFYCIRHATRVPLASQTDLFQPGVFRNITKNTLDLVFSYVEITSNYGKLFLIRTVTNVSVFSESRNCNAINKL